MISPVGDQYFMKRGALVTAEHRARMVELAIGQFDADQPSPADRGYLRCDRWESSQAGWTRTLRVLEHFEQEFAGQSAPDGG